MVIGGGRSNEHEVSLASAAAVRHALGSLEYDVHGLTILPDGRWAHVDGGAVAGGAPEAFRLICQSDVVFPAVHGARGEDGTLAGLCEIAGVPIVGSGVRAGALAMDKWTTKLIAAELGLSVAPGMVVTRAQSFDVPSTWIFPSVVKPASSGSSHGVSVVDHATQLPAALDAAFQHDDRVLVERLIVGREVDIAVLKRADGTLHLSPPLEITVRSGTVFDTDSKYGAVQPFTIPADLTTAERGKVEQAAVRLFRAIGCGGVARVDFFLTPDGPVLNEINTMPGLTPLSQVPLMFAAAGIPFPKLLDALIDAALHRHVRLAEMQHDRPRDSTRPGRAS
jgi:D-alanine-D-alanine ligase